MKKIFLTMMVLTFACGTSTFAKQLKDTIYVPYEWKVVKKVCSDQNGLDGIKVHYKDAKGELAEAFILCPNPRSRSFRFKNWMGNDFKLQLRPATTLAELVWRFLSLLHDYRFFVYGMLALYIIVIKGLGVQDSYYRFMH